MSGLGTLQQKTAGFASEPSQLGKKEQGVTSSRFLSFAEMVEQMPLPILVVQSNGSGFRMNSAALRLAHMESHPRQLPEWIGEELALFQYSQAAERSSDLSFDPATGTERVMLQAEFRRLDGNCGFDVIVTFYDVSRYKNALQALKLSEERYHTIVDNQFDIIVKTDLLGIIDYASPSFRKILGLQELELVGHSLLPLIAGDQYTRLYEKINALACMSLPCTEELCMQSEYADRYISWSIKVVSEDDTNVGGLIFVGRDVTEQKQAEWNIQQLAYFDSLTGLPNRVLLQDRLQSALSQARRDECKVGILFVDLDRFKNINDSLGHSSGDELLRQTALRLKENIRETDTVARHGGDEFVAILNNIKQGDQAAKVAHKIVSAFSYPFLINGNSTYSGASIGIALYPDDGADGDTLLKHADMAMYLAKENGRGKFTFFSQELDDRIRERSLLEADLRRAVEQNEFFLHFQPQFNVAQRRIRSFEAFVRWNHPEHGVLLPGSFIPLAEETGLIIPLGEWVLKTACKQAAGWRTLGMSNIPVSVNLSSRQFRHPDLLSMVAAAVLYAGLPPTCLELEITEGTLLDNTDESLSTLQELKWQGVQTAIDDFGTGYSSLPQLKRCLINRIKIDSSFTQNIQNSSDDADIAEAIISLGQSMKLQVAAEGVERREQLQFLYDRGCEEMQGNYFSCPLPFANLQHSDWFYRQGQC